MAASVWKLKHEPRLSRRAESIFRASLSRVGPGPDTLVVPVPQSRKRNLERGYNQAEILASLVSKTLAVRMASNAFVRTSHTPIHRAAMDRKARAATVEKSFEVRIPRLVTDRNILLVDDVLTSGSTASACASVLKKNGAARVDVITLARAVMHGRD
jgi:ComF family protein